MEELTESEKHDSYIHLVETLGVLSRRGPELTPEWMADQIARVRWIRETCPDMSLINQERQDRLFRTNAQKLELYLSDLISELDLCDTLNLETYTCFCTCALQMMEWLQEDDDLSNAFTNFGF